MPKLSSLDKKRNLLLGLGVSFLFLCGSYLNFAVRAQQLSGQLFDFTDTVSWRQTEGNVFRLDAKGNIENILLSKRSWKDFTLSVVIVNPRDCGLAYNYQNEKNFNLEGRPYSVTSCVDPF